MDERQDGVPDLPFGAATTLIVFDFINSMPKLSLTLTLLLYLIIKP
jgi:hypothetical protein